MNFLISPVDVTVLAVYVLGSRLFFGWYLARKGVSGGAEKYFLADRNLAWPLIGFSFYVSNMSGSTFIGLPGSGYNDGIAVYNYEWLPAVILIFFAFFILPSFLNTRVYTAPEFLGRRYDDRSRLMFSGFLILANVFIDAASALYAGGMIMKVLFPGVPLWLTSAVISGIAGVYIIFGGLSAVVLNDVLQALVIFTGGSVIAVMTYMNIPSWDAVKAAVPENALHLMRPVGDKSLPWPGNITGVLVVGIYFWCTNQFVIQRALGARSLNHGRLGALFAGFLKLPNLFILVLPGVMAVSLYPALERPDMVFPALAFDLLPVGARGLMLAALAAAIMSSLESIFNSASTMLTMDFVSHFKPGMSDESLVKTGKWATVAFMVISAVWAPQISRFETLWQYLQSILSYVTPQVVAVFLTGIFWHRASAAAAFWTLVLGIPMGAAGWVCNEIMGITHIHYLYASGIIFTVSCLFIALISFILPERCHCSQGMVDFSVLREEARILKNHTWYRDYRVLSLLLLVFTACIVVWWW